jgi:prevent-host-death family protein
MRAYTYSEARENFARVLEEAERDGAVEIRRRAGAAFRLSPVLKSKAEQYKLWWNGSADWYLGIKPNRGAKPYGLDDTY